MKLRKSLVKNVELIQLFQGANRLIKRQWRRSCRVLEEQVHQIWSRRDTNVDVRLSRAVFACCVNMCSPYNRPMYNVIFVFSSESDCASNDKVYSPNDSS